MRRPVRTLRTVRLGEAPAAKTARFPRWRALTGLVSLAAVAGVLVAGALAPAVAATSLAASGGITLFESLPHVLTIDAPMAASTVYAKDPKTGKFAPLARFFQQDRIPVGYNQIAPVMVDAIVSSEDPRFFSEGPLDLWGTLRAAANNLGGGKLEGGSTITQQYVKNVLVQGCEHSAASPAELSACYARVAGSSGSAGVQRKLQELRYAINVERRYTKQQILTRYLNIVGFGGNVYGIEAAARHYFGVSALSLTLDQAATLAGMVQDPNALRIDTPASATNGAANAYALTRARRDYVLGRMLDGGKIRDAEHEQAIASPVVPQVHAIESGCAAAQGATYFCQYVQDVIATSTAFGKTPEERYDTLMRGGLKIYTTLDWNVQTAANAAMHSTVPGVVEGVDLGAATVSVQASTGSVLSITQNTTYGQGSAPGTSALVFAGDLQQGGSTGFSAGSTFKLFTLLDWLETGHSLYQRVDGRDRTILRYPDRCLPGGVFRNTSGWMPGNFEGESGYVGTPMQFTAQSLNTGYLAMAAQLDLCDIGNLATTLGVTLGNGQSVPLAGNTPLTGPDEILGSDAVSPIAMAAAYATIANGGVRCEPLVIQSATGPDGHALPVQQRACTRVVSSQVAAEAATALHGVMRYGTGQAANPEDGTSLIGKTGTHQSLQTWIIESNTQVTTASWVGDVQGAGDLYATWYQGAPLADLRYPLWRKDQGPIDSLYPGAGWPSS